MTNKEKNAQEIVLAMNRVYVGTGVVYVYNPSGFIERYEYGCLTHLKNFDEVTIWRKW